MKNLSIALFFQMHRKKYIFLSNLLPIAKISTVDQWLRNIRCAPGINEDVFHLLQLKVYAKKSDNLCVLLLDEISLRSKLEYDKYSDQVLGFCTTKSDTDAIQLDRENYLKEKHGNIEENDKCSNRTLVNTKHFADSAVVFMLHGLSSSWKMAIGYSLCSRSIKSNDLITELNTYIAKTEECGLNVMAISSDMGSNFSKCFRQLGVTTDRPIMLTDKSKEVVVVKDLTHLMKNSRGLLNRQDINVPNFDLKASWKHLRMLYQKSIDRDIRIAPKLMKNYLYNLSGPLAMKALPAFRTLSRKVSVGLSLFASKGLLPSGAKATYNYCRNFNDLSDVLNSRNLNDTTLLRRPLKQQSSGIRVLHEKSLWIKELKRLNPTGNRLVHLNGWLQTINGVQLILKKMVENHGKEFLMTRNLTTDPLENFFSRIRQIHKFPSSKDFSQGFKKVACDPLVSYVSSAANCEKDKSFDLVKIDEFLDSVKNPTKVLDSNLTDIEDDEQDEEFEVGRVGDSIDYSSCSYFGGYIISKLRVFHIKKLGIAFEDCHHCKSLEDQQDNNSQIHIVNKMSEYDEKIRLNYCSASFVEFLMEAGQCFNYIFYKYIAFPQIKARVKTFIEKKPNAIPTFCCNAVKEFVLEKYTIVKIHDSCNILINEFQTNTTAGANTENKVANKKKENKMKTIKHT